VTLSQQSRLPFSFSKREVGILGLARVCPNPARILLAYKQDVLLRQ